MSLSFFKRAFDRQGRNKNILRLQSLTASGTVTVTLLGEMNDMDCVKAFTLAVGDYLYLDQCKIEKFTYVSATGTLDVDFFQMSGHFQPAIMLDAGEAKNVIKFAPEVSGGGFAEGD